MTRKTMNILAAIVLSVTTGLAQQGAAPAPSDPIIISADSVTVRQSEFEAALKGLPAQYQQQFSTGPGRKRFAEDYLRMKLLAAGGIKAGLDKTPAVTDQLQLMKDNLIANAQVEALEKAIAVTDAELRQAYESRKADYESVTASHIMVAPKGSPAAPENRQMTDAEAQTKAEDIRKRIAGGADFAQVAKTESDDKGSGERGGELGPIKAGQMVPEFERAVFALKKGEISAVVKSEFGYHVIKVTERETTPFESVRAELDQDLRESKMKDLITAMVISAKATFNDSYFGPTPAK
jgi:peptidyl-prolyl cis-trans isomerase C